MKITWFAKTCFRLHTGGQVIVTDPDKAPEDVLREELTSGADKIVSLGEDDLGTFDPSVWRQRRPYLAVDGDTAPPPALYRLDTESLFVDTPGEAPLIVAVSRIGWGRFADNAAVVLAGSFDRLVVETAAVCEIARPRLIVLASHDIERSHFSALAGAAAGTPIQLLEAGLALEI